MNRRYRWQDAAVRLRARLVHGVVLVVPDADLRPRDCGVCRHTQSSVGTMAFMSRRSSSRIPLSTSDQPLNGRSVTRYWMVWGTGQNVTQATESLLREAEEGGAEEVIGVRICSAPAMHQGRLFGGSVGAHFVVYGTAVQF